MSEKPRKIRITTDERGYMHAFDPSGEEIQCITSMTIFSDPKNGFRPVVQLTLIDAEIDMNATIERETTVSYKWLERQ